jgi:SpoVK/Ycf46/Vps4 family AAA+-type ATPase
LINSNYIISKIEIEKKLIDENKERLRLVQGEIKKNENIFFYEIDKGPDQINDCFNILFVVLS